MKPAVILSFYLLVAAPLWAASKLKATPPACSFELLLIESQNHLNKLKTLSTQDNPYPKYAIELIHRRITETTRFASAVHFLQSFHLLNQRARILTEGLLDIQNPNLELPKNFSETFWQAPQFWLGELLGRLRTQNALASKVPPAEAQALGERFKKDFWALEHLLMPSSHPAIGVAVEEVWDPIEKGLRSHSVSVEEERIYYRNLLEKPLESEQHP